MLDAGLGMVLRREENDGMGWDAEEGVWEWERNALVVSRRGRRGGPGGGG